MSPPQTRDSVLALTTQNDRVCPLPQQWSRLYDLLPGRQRVGSSWQPPLPVTLAAWDDTPSILKIARLREHIEWAHSHGAIEQVGTFLASLPEAAWHHFGD